MESKESSANSNLINNMQYVTQFVITENKKASGYTYLVSNIILDFGMT